MAKITIKAEPGYSLLKRNPYKESIAFSTPILAWQYDEETEQVSPITMTGVALIDRSEVLLPHDEKEPMEAGVVYLKTGECVSLDTYLKRGDDDYKCSDDPEVWPAFPDPCLQDGGGFTFDGRHDDHAGYRKMDAEMRADPRYAEDGDRLTHRNVSSKMLQLTGLSSKAHAMSILKKHGGVTGLSKLEQPKFFDVYHALKDEIEVMLRAKRAAATAKRKAKRKVKP